MRPLRGPFPYLELNPDVPLCPAYIVTLSWDAHSEDVLAILDSGADMTFIPQRFVHEFSLIKTDEAQVGGVTDKKYQKQDVYGINIQCAALGFHFSFMDVVPLDGLTGDRVLIGRDILNKHRITLDGVAEEFTIE